MKISTVIPLAILSVLAGVVAGCNTDHTAQPTAVRQRAAQRLQPLAGPVDASWKRGRSYVPVYSSIDWGLENVLVDLGVTLSIRNVAKDQEVVIESVEYFDSAGRRVRQYLESPSKLGGLASVEFVIAQRDRTGGPGANFLVDWAIPADGEDPFIEAVMVGQHGAAGISFASPGRVTRRPK